MRSTSRDGLFAERAGGHDGLGTCAVQLFGDAAGYGELLRIVDGRVGERRATAKGVASCVCRLKERANGLDYRARLIVNAAASS